MKYGQWEYGLIVRYISHRKNFRLPLKLSQLRESRQKYARASHLQCSQSASHRFTFGRVTAHHVNIAISTC